MIKFVSYKVFNQSDLNLKSVLFSIARRTPFASAFDALNDFAFLKIISWHSAYAPRPKLRVLLLNTLQTAKPFIALLFPFCDQIGVSPLLPKTVVVKFATNFFLLVKEVVNVARHLVVSSKDGPNRFWLSFSLKGLIFVISHFLLQLGQSWLDLVPPGRHSFTWSNCISHFWHLWRIISYK